MRKKARKNKSIALVRLSSLRRFNFAKIFLDGLAGDARSLQSANKSYTAFFGQQRQLINDKSEMQPVMMLRLESKSLDYPDVLALELAGDMRQIYTGSAESRVQLSQNRQLIVSLDREAGTLENALALVYESTHEFNLELPVDMPLSRLILQQENLVGPEQNAVVLQFRVRPELRLDDNVTVPQPANPFLHPLHLLPIHPSERTRREFEKQAREYVERTLIETGLLPKEEAMQRADPEYAAAIAAENDRIRREAAEELTKRRAEQTRIREEHNEADQGKPQNGVEQRIEPLPVIREASIDDTDRGAAEMDALAEYRVAVSRQIELATQFKELSRVILQHEEFLPRLEARVEQMLDGIDSQNEAQTQQLNQVQQHNRKLLADIREEFRRAGIIITQPGRNLAADVVKLEQSLRNITGYLQSVNNKIDTIAERVVPSIPLDLREREREEFEREVQAGWDAYVGSGFNRAFRGVNNYREYRHPHSVRLMLQRASSSGYIRIGGATYRISSSLTAGVSLHRKSKGLDYIFHL